MPTMRSPIPRRHRASRSGRASFQQTLGSVEGTILATDATYQAFGGTPTSYVTGLYNAILDRAPDPTGLAYYAGLISAGDSRQDVINQLQGTDEAKRTEVARWYQTELNWDEPIADLKVNSGVEYWASRIDGGLSDDVVHAMILAAGLAPGRQRQRLRDGALPGGPGPRTRSAGLAYSSGQLNRGSAATTSPWDC